MKVIMLDTKQYADVSDSYGARLIEQGYAILAPKEQPEKPEASHKKRNAGVTHNGAC